MLDSLPGCKVAQSSFSKSGLQMAPGKVKIDPWRVLGFLKAPWQLWRFSLGFLLESLGAVAGVLGGPGVILEAS